MKKDSAFAPRLAIAIDTAFSMQVLSNSSGKRLSARVLGMRQGESIIACIDDAAFGTGDLRLDDQVAVRFMRGRSVYGFETTVIRICISPYAYFHLAYPTTVQHVEVRQTERVGLTVPVTVNDSSGTSVEAELCDLSSSGALLIAADVLGALGGHVEISFKLVLGQLTRAFQLQGTIRNSGVFSDLLTGSQKHRHGVQFLEVGEADTLFLLAFIYERVAAISAATTLGDETISDAST